MGFLRGKGISCSMTPFPKTNPQRRRAKFGPYRPRAALLSHFLPLINFSVLPAFLFSPLENIPELLPALGTEPVSLHDLLADIQAESFPQLLGAPVHQRLPRHRPRHRHLPQPERAGQQKPHVLRRTSSLRNPTSLTRVPPACTARRTGAASSADPAHLYCLRLVPASLRAYKSTQAPSAPVSSHC